MTLEDQILNIAEAPNWYDSRELRAIALEVRKREDRIKQLEEQLMEVKNKHSAMVADVVLDEDRAERIKRLEEALDLVRPHCDSVHHSKKHQHQYGEPCPVVALIENAKEAKL